MRAEVLALHAPAPEVVPLGLREAASAGVKYLQQKGWLKVNNSSSSKSDGRRQNSLGGCRVDLGLGGKHNQLAERPHAGDDAAHLLSACEQAVFVFLSTVFDASDEAFYSGEYLAHGTGTGMALALFRVGSRLNHSCLPNCWWRVESGKHMVTCIETAA